jgi:hypothetical protein
MTQMTQIAARSSVTLVSSGKRIIRELYYALPIKVLSP